MRESEAIRVVSMLGAAFNRDLGEDTMVLWARSLTDCEMVDAVEAIEVAMQAGRFLPSLAELLDLIRDCRNTRLKNATPALPPSRPGRVYTLAEHLATHPEDRERALALSPDTLMGFTFAEIVRQEMGK
jgi:hypothetical protein